MVLYKLCAQRGHSVQYAPTRPTYGSVLAKQGHFGPFGAWLVEFCWHVATMSDSDRGSHSTCFFTRGGGFLPHCQWDPSAVLSLLNPSTNVGELGAQSSFKLQQFLCSRGYAMDNLDEAQRIHPS